MEHFVRKLLRNGRIQRPEVPILGSLRDHLNLEQLAQQIADDVLAVPATVQKRFQIRKFWPRGDVDQRHHRVLFWYLGGVAEHVYHELLEQHRRIGIYQNQARKEDRLRALAGLGALVARIAKHRVHQCRVLLVDREEVEYVLDYLCVRGIVVTGLVFDEMHYPRYPYRVPRPRCEGIDGNEHHL